MTLAQGMSVRIVGQSEAVGQNTVFLARLVQAGSKVVAVRSNHGIPLAPSGARAQGAAKNAASREQGGAR